MAADLGLPSNPITSSSDFNNYKGSSYVSASSVGTNLTC